MKNIALRVVETMLVCLVLLSGCGHQSPKEQHSSNSPAPHKSKPESSAVVFVAKPQRETFRHQITIAGTLRAFEETTVYSKVAGYLEWVRVDIGDWVRKGEVVAKIEIPEMFDELQEAQAALHGVEADYEKVQAELQQIQADFELKEITYHRLQRVRNEEPDVVPQQRVDEAKADFKVAAATIQVVESKIIQVKSDILRRKATLGRLKTLMAYAKVRAPFRGVVTERFVDSGALIQSGTASQNVQPIITVARIDTVRVAIDVPETKVPLVQNGDSASIILDALPGKTFEGKVARFSMGLNPLTRTMKTEIDIPNPKRFLRPGMYSQVTLLLEESQGILTIPAEALRGDGKRKFVYSVSNDLVKEIEVETIFEDGIKIGVSHGLNGGEDVVVTSRRPITHGTEVMSVAWQSGGE